MSTITDAVRTLAWTDPFTRADAATLGAPWVEDPAGTWNIAGDPFYVAYADLSAIATASRPTGVDVEIDAQVKVGAGDTIAGIHLSDGGGKRLGFEVVKTGAEQKVVLYTRTAGVADVERVSNPVALAGDTVYRMRLARLGDKVEARLDDALVGEYTIGPELLALLVGTGAGLVNFTGNANFLVVTASTLTAPPAPEPVLGAWLTQAEVDEWLGRSGDFDAARAEQARLAAASYVEDVRRDLAPMFAEPDTYPVPPRVRMGAVLLASRLYARKGTALGVASYGEFGSSSIPRLDPDIERMLGLGRHARPRVG